MGLSESYKTEHRAGAPRFTAMTYQETATHAEPATSDGGAIIPIIGGGILTLLWGAYTLTYVAHMVMMPIPAL